MNITVYCGVAEGKDPAYKQAALDTGTWIARAGHTLVYGGGGIGLMGAISNAVLDHGGKVLGIIPRFLVEREQLNKRLENVVVVEDMAERKRQLFENADAFIMLPGGIGTFEEITEVLSQMKLGFLDKPVYIMNINGFYDHFVAALDGILEEGFLEEGESPFTVVTTIDELSEALD